MNDVEVLSADIRNAYLQPPTTEKHYIICGPKFGIEHQGNKALIIQALYGCKVAGQDFWHHLRICMDFLGFKYCKADPDVWVIPANHADVSEYYEYVLMYTKNCLVISDNAESILRGEIGAHWDINTESIGPAKIYIKG